MRTLTIAFALLLVAGVSRAATPPGPRIAALAKKLAAHEAGAEAAFWRQAAAEGTPFVEDAPERGNRLVTFVWHGTAATRRVQLRGPVADQDADLVRLEGSNVFATTLSLPDSGRFIYGFVVDGDPRKRPSPDQIHHDPLNKHPFDVVSSLLELPHAPAQPSLVAHAGVAGGTVWRHTMPAAAPKPARQLFVYTPPGYSAKGPAYPLLVAFDAEAFSSSIPLAVILDELIAAKRIPPVVALMIGNVDRRRELAPNAEFADFVALDLVPWVRAHYHATSDPRRTVLSGISLGGLSAAYQAYRHPEVFGNVLSQSGSFWYGPEGDEPEVTARDFVKAARLPIRFWMEVGRFEFGGPRPETTQLAANRHLRDVLTARGYDVSYREFDGDHSDACWRGTIADGIVALFGTVPKLAAAHAPKPSPRPPVAIGPALQSTLPLLVRAGLVDGGDAALAAAKKLLASSPTGYLLDEDEINQAGCMLMMLGHPRESLPLLQWNTERFPKSWNTWDSLAWGYFTLGDLPNAIKNFKQELVLDPKNPVGTTMLGELSAIH